MSLTAAPDPLLVKIFPLRVPSFHPTPSALTWDQTELPGTQPFYPQHDGDTEFGISPFLKLPSTFGKVFFGQVFQGMVTIRGRYRTLTQVSVKVEIPETKKVILDSPNIPIIRSGESKDFYFSVEALLLGTSRIVCTVTYLDSFDSTFRSARAQMEFTTTNPLAVKSRITQYDDILYLQAQLSNISNVPFLLSSMTLLPFFPFPLSPHAGAGETEGGGDTHSSSLGCFFPSSSTAMGAEGMGSPVGGGPTGGSGTPVDSALCGGLGDESSIGGGQGERSAGEGAGGGVGARVESREKLARVKEEEEEGGTADGGVFRLR